MQRVMCIWIPDWPLQRLAIERPDLQGRTVVLYEATPQGGLKVVAATEALGTSDLASNMAAGIYPGMPLVEAAALVAAQHSGNARSLPAVAGGIHSVGNALRGFDSVGNALRGVPGAPTDLGAPLSNAGTAPAAAGKLRPFPPGSHLEPADPDVDRLALEQLAEWCQRFSPIVGVEEAPRPECLLLDVTGLASLFGGECMLANEVVCAFAQRGLNVHVALADTIGAAWAAVHAEPMTPASTTLAPGSAGGPRLKQDHPSAEPRAKEESGASGQIVLNGETLTALTPLPIGYLRVDDDTVALLATLGITRIGQLAALPRSALLARFGPDLLRRLDQAMGRAPETILACRAPPEHTADFTFEAPIANREAIEHVLGQLIAQVVEPLVRRREGILRLTCRLKYEQHSVGNALRGVPEHSVGNALRGVPEPPNGVALSTHPIPARREHRGRSLQMHRDSVGNAPSLSPPLQSRLLHNGPPDLISSLILSLGLFRPSASPEYLRDLLRLRLENVRLAGPVTNLHVEATAIGRLELQQQTLFDSEANRDQPRRLGELVDRLSNRLGRSAVVQVALLPDAQPEYTCVDLPLAGGTATFGGNPVRGDTSVGNGLRGDNSVGNGLRAVPLGELMKQRRLALPERHRGRSLQNQRHRGRSLQNQRHRGRSLQNQERQGTHKAKKSAKKNLAHVTRYGLLSFAPDERPLQLLAQPARIEVVAIAPSGAPAQFRWAGQSYSIAYAWGPERIETGWWRTAQQDQESRKTFVRRDYYRVETTSGARFWIFRRLADRQWFLQGTFD